MAGVLNNQNYTEDEIREMAGYILGFKEEIKNVKAGVGQLTTFNQLGFKGVNDKPDGWYLPDNTNEPAIILEAKSSLVELKDKQVEEIKKNCTIALTKYKNVIGILYNGFDIKVYRNNNEIETTNELQNKEYYIGLLNKNKIDKDKIYSLTAKINNCLHTEFGIKNLYHRMIFTACALVAKRYDAPLNKKMDYETFSACIKSTLKTELKNGDNVNPKIDILLEVFSDIKMNTTSNQEAISNFIEWVTEISDSINSDYWNGEDVMGIFFNEFNRYKKKSESGQVFTPDHVTSLMYRLIGVHKDDVILDAACGSGAFLVKAMCNMISEAGGINTLTAKNIKSKQLYGIEFDREIYALACANMLIHKDGKTNLVQLDSRTEEARNWIRDKNITKVLMNPPFENKYGCIQIVKNVLDSVPMGTLCAFILPEKKLEKVNQTLVKRILMKHTLKKIVKLPEKTFSEGITTSVFIFESGIPQNDKEIFACYISEDGLETVKNQGRHDVKGKWQSIEDKWVNIINKQSGDDSIQWIKPGFDVDQHLSYQVPAKELELYDEDFRKTVLDYYFYNNKIDIKNFNDNLINNILYNGSFKDNKNNITIEIPKDDENE
ncbi:MAG: N-6 DNA methylase [Tissierellia bacterium]|nr:N-6 DNA methylase [Tissierellia bacterium]